VKALLGIVLWLALAAYAALWLAACVTGLGLLAGLVVGVVLAVLLAALRLTWLLQLAVCVGALAVWHWPVVLALLLAIPRAVLVLPGWVSTTLANRRHPRARWS
jgi:hypothetical protein